MKKFKKATVVFHLSLLIAALVFMGLKSDDGNGPLTDQYIVIAWNDLGMHCANLEFANMCILPPYNNQKVQVIKKGDAMHLPVVMNGTSGIYVSYEIPGNSVSVGKTNFWDYTMHLFGVTLPPNVGLAGFGMSGMLSKSDTLNYQFAEGIPITAFPDSTPTVSDPYQLTLIRAYAATGQLLASTQSVIPVSHEINCVSSGCHASEMAILQKHDQVSGFNIADKPILCATCHADPALGMPGHPGVPKFSQVIHEKHGEFIKTGTTADCYKCHPGPNTSCWRDVMHTTTGAITKCQNCHGSVYNVGKTVENGRQPWLQEPSCGAATCHGPQYAEEPGKLFKNSRGHGGLFCSACHNSPHAILPTTQPRDNVQNIALQGFAGTLSECSVCHGYTPTGPGPHGIPAVQVLQNVNVTSSQVSCYNATQNITLAGSGTTFQVNAGGSATLIAGRDIAFLPGTSVQQGGYLRAYITSKGRYCNSILAPLAPVTLLDAEETPAAAHAGLLFNIYPNPSSGEFVVDFNNELKGKLVTVSVMNLFGKVVSSNTFMAKSAQAINIESVPPGLYFVRVSGTGYAGSEKLVRE